MNTSDISILYVEDDALVQEVICSLIHNKFTTVRINSAGSAEEGLELFRKHHQDIIITDINLVESDGIQMVKSIRKLDPETIIIFMSGCLDVERISGFEGPGPCHYLRKPIDFHDLFTLLDSYIHKIGHNTSEGLICTRGLAVAESDQSAVTR